MKEYLITQYENAFKMARCFEGRSGQLNHDIVMEYTGARQAIGKILTDCGYMTESELKEYHCNLLLNQAV